MNIEQIAQEVDTEMYEEGKAEGALNYPGEFLRRCLSKLAEQAGEPVATATRNVHGTLGMQWNNIVPHGTKLYTEAQYIAAQQRTAEACAKTCDEGAEKLLHFLEQNGAAKCSEAIRFEKKWMEYL